MGEMAEMLINGDCDFFTGEYIGNGQGFPRSGESNSWFNKRQQRNPKAGVEKFLRNRKCTEIQATVQKYQDDVLHINGIPKYNTICRYISADFSKFVKWYNSQKNSHGKIH